MNQSDRYSAPTLDVDLGDVPADEGQPAARGGTDGTTAVRPETPADGESVGADKGQDAPPAEVGYRGTTAHTVAGITYRQLDYWARTGLVVPSVRDASGSGTQRLYSFRDIVVLKVVKRLLDAGVSLQNIRKAIETLRRRGVEDLANVTLISDGTTVYECRSAEEIVDLLQGGQGVFAIALSGPFREIQGTLAQLPATEVAEDTPASGPPAPMDELAVRRARRRAG
ncbi:MAG: MerR family transcriptional regulator [Micromonosporaceae bacterium]|nr:MerR family transcriptional regulator [Micromonosporaceae bacterium]